MLWSRSNRLSLARLLECAPVRLSSHSTIPRTCGDPNIPTFTSTAASRRCCSRLSAVLLGSSSRARCSRASWPLYASDQDVDERNDGGTHIDPIGKVVTQQFAGQQSIRP